MAASAIIISSDSSDESVGSPPSRVILFGDIPTVIPSTSVVAPETSTIAPVISSAAPMVETTLVASPTGLCGLILLSSDSLMDHHCRTFVDTCSLGRQGNKTRPFIIHMSLLLLLLLPAGIHRIWSGLLSTGEAIPFGRPYRTHLNGPRKLLTARRLWDLFPSRSYLHQGMHHLVLRSRSSSSSSSSDSSPVHSLGLDAPDQAHSGSSTRDVSPRLCYPPRRAP
ncbi:hypothetical protein Tco_1079943 [Tanacetum coccineum]|uniref:Uncharacterized protein n=1 Tax=Tanacetum coccineum TaxID=301880 RepID=A0ABQ5HTD2_9ASTR